MKKQFLYCFSPGCHSWSSLFTRLFPCFNNHNCSGRLSSEHLNCLTLSRYVNQELNKLWMVTVGLWVLCLAPGQRVSEVSRLHRASIISTLPHHHPLNHPPYHPSLQLSSQASGTPKSRCSKIESLPSSSFAAQSLCSTLMKVVSTAVQLSFHIHQITQEEPLVTNSTVLSSMQKAQWNRWDTLLC